MFLFYGHYLGSGRSWQDLQASPQRKTKATKGKVVPQTKDFEIRAALLDFLPESWNK
jgi:hypothetical protein